MNIERSFYQTESKVFTNTEEKIVMVGQRVTVENLHVEISLQQVYNSK